ncbi:MAG: hypothetical protein JWN70_4008 [Planctomycetaceae bacterium]|nr:hypothetical protein [Planctomycetaceae bacterium]
MISPRRPLCLLVLLPVVTSFLLYVSPTAWPLVAAMDTLALLFALTDLCFLPGKKTFSVRREMARVASRGERHAVALLIDNHSRHTQVVVIRDDQLPGMTQDPCEFSQQLPGRSRLRVEYILTPHRRGTYRLEYAYLRVESRWKLWCRTIRLPVQDELRVYPALKQIGRYALYARLNRMSLLGVRRVRRVGFENEFERLRDYTPDDQFKFIDWRTSARRQKLTVRDFQSSQSQRVLFVLDCGRMMVSEADGQSMLDLAIDAALTLSYVALAKQDQVGLLCFSDRVVRWIGPAGGHRQLNRLVHALHDVEPQFVESQLDTACLHLQQHCRKRTLVILISNVLDDRQADQIRSHLATMVGQHLPLAVFLRDWEVFKPLAKIPTIASADDDVPDGVSRAALFKAAAAAEILKWRHQTLMELRHAGVLCLDSFPEDLTAPLVNEYLRIKNRHLL